MSSEFEQMFPSRLKDMRRDAGLTQYALCDATGIDQSRISRLEMGEATPTIAELFRLADVFAIDIVDLLGAGGSGAEVNATARRLVKLAKQLNEKDRDLLIQFGELLVKRMRK